MQLSSVSTDHLALLCQTVFLVTPQGVHSDSVLPWKDTCTRCFEGTLACVFNFDSLQQSVSTFSTGQVLNDNEKKN